MCGIVGYIGPREAYPILIQGLKRLEYRGYDSAGVALMNGGLEVFKKMGKVSALEAVADAKRPHATLGIGHTRWATHGAPSDRNAHPHRSNSGRLVIVHNGIIENYAQLKELLATKGYTFASDTDTEVLVNFIEFIQNEEQVNLQQAVRLALNEVVGAYAIAVLSTDEPDQMVVGRLGSPLVLGLGDNEFFVGSDATPFIDSTKKVIYLEDGEMAVVQRSGVVVRKIANDLPVDSVIHQLQLDLAAIEKGGFDHFMIKEIFEQPKSIMDTVRGRLNFQTGEVKMAGLDAVSDKLLAAQRILVIGCGTSWHAGLVGEYLIEDLARVPVEVEYGSEFRYRNPIIGPNDVVIAVSQSGETADTLAAIKMAKANGATVFGICNVVGSSIARETHAGAYTHAGPEIGVASTKAFTAQVTVFTLIAMWLGQKKGVLSAERAAELAHELQGIPAKIETVLKLDAKIREIAKTMVSATNALFLGRGYNFPVALEGALKLKEISYIHAEGYPAAEMKHGPIALIDEHMPVVVIAPFGELYEKLVSNVQEVKARKGRIYAITGEGSEAIASVSDELIAIPTTDEALSPLLTTVPLQLLSYHVAVLRGCNVDQPRNLAKSVTVE
ncbi:MAG: glutamine--fructose-6-phosphate transaminase (isomerizing) [Cryomorphaceae bacterium]|jgi:glucosamine--fructose-6-phosphate aminotransferase (isomerizing)|nr:glutamine--fructose-6-phosphate transaminase (isomerizing) [Cryomorphaceae bacterium]